MNAYAFVKAVAMSAGTRWWLALSCLATGLYTATLVVQPLLVAAIVRDLAAQSDAPLQPRVLLLAAAMGFSAALAYVVASINNVILQTVRRDSKTRLYGAVLEKPASFFGQFNEGGVEIAIATASQAARNMTQESMGTLIRALLFVALSSALAARELPLQGGIFCIGALTYMGLAWRRARSASRSVAYAVTSTIDASREAADMLANVASIQAGAMQVQERRRLLQFLERERSTYRRGQAVLDCNDFVQKLYLTALFMAFVVTTAIGTRGDAAGAIMFYIIGLLAYAQLDVLGRSLNSLFEHAHRLQAVLDRLEIAPPSGVAQESSGHEAIGPMGIDLRHVSFSYVPGKPVLQDLSLRIAPGSRLLVVGPSGAGKSTLLRIMAGQLAPQSGRVLLGGKDLFACSLQQRSRMVSVIPQHATLFQRSLHENATYGAGDVPRQQLQDLLLGLKLERLQRAGGAQWLDAVVDAKGMNLSGGEKQRILLARAILCARPVLLLDEAAGALDEESEAAVWRLLHERLPHATIVVVSHHPHAALASYQRLVLGGGPAL